MNSYVTLQGDTWDLIAKKTMGSESYISQLIEANIAYMQTVIFSAGITLSIPAMKTTISSSLPPWKRGTGT